MGRGRWATVATICGDSLGVANLILLAHPASAKVTLGLAVVLAPFTLALALRPTAFLACHVVSLVLSSRRDRVELLICAIGGLQPPLKGEKYREAILAELRAAPSHQVAAIRTDLMKNAPRTIVAAWAHVPRPPGQGARNAIGP